MTSPVAESLVTACYLDWKKRILFIDSPDFNGDFRYSTCTGTSQTSTYNHFQCLQCNTVYNLKSEKIQAHVPADYLAHTVHILTAAPPTSLQYCFNLEL